MDLSCIRITLQNKDTIKILGGDCQENQEESLPRDLSFNCIFIKKLCDLSQLTFDIKLTDKERQRCGASHVDPRVRVRTQQHGSRPILAQFCTDFGSYLDRTFLTCDAT